MGAQVTITYKCCGADYSAPVALVGSLDGLHTQEHPECATTDDKETDR